MSGRKRVDKRARSKRKKKKRGRILLRILTLFVVCMMPFLLLKTAAASEKSADIHMEVVSAEILQNEEMPKQEVKVTVDGDTNFLLDKKTGYTVENLIEDLESGKRYTLQCAADPKIEGEYPATIHLDEDVTAALEKDWIGLAQIEVTNGSFAVKNPVGEWDGNKFKRYDGSYVTDDFVVSMGNTYYFDSDGNKATGWHPVRDTDYCFTDDGIMMVGFQDIEDARYYFGTDGKKATGWQTIDGSEYYFGEDGKMATGEVKIGTTICKFNENGVLESKKSTIVDPSKPMIALTFDDGPGSRTNEILDTLEKYNARATFFMLGQKVPSYGNAVKRMKSLKCELGNHSYDHADLSKLSVDGVQSEVNKTNDNIRTLAGEGATVMRPPYGAISSNVRTGVGMPMILWNIDTLDWKTRDAQKTIDCVMKEAKDGDIILMHDIHTESVDAAIKLIPMLQEKGFQLVTVSELAAAKGQTMENGKAYTDF